MWKYRRKLFCRNGSYLLWPYCAMTVIFMLFFFPLCQAAFKAVMHLWNKKPLKVYGSRMSESILAILCHIIKGENIIVVSNETQTVASSHEMHRFIRITEDKPAEENLKTSMNNSTKE